MRLRGELALVTGSTAGIGRAIATRFAAEGARVAVTGRDAARGAEVVGEIAAAGGTALFLPADLGDESSCHRLVDDAAAGLGGLTVLVNTAATGAGDAPVAHLATGAWETILRVNLSAPMWCCRAALPHMLAAGRGSIVNLSSRQAHRPSPGHPAYVASKAGLVGLTRALAVEYASRGIRANTISPGYVLNDRRDRDLRPQQRARLEAMHLTRLGTAADVAAAAVFLASRESELLTGADLPLDGGSSVARAATFG